MPTTPPTFIAGDPVAAAELNQLGDGITELQAVAEGVTFSGCQIKRTANQSIPNTTWTVVTWQTESGGFDIGGWWSSGTDIIVPAGAIPSGATSIAIDVNARTSFASNGTGSRFIRTLLNGTQTEKTPSPALGGGDSTEVTIYDTIVVVAGDVLTVEVYQSSGGALNITGTNTKITVERRGTVV